jgi:hypothetical protein
MLDAKGLELECREAVRFAKAMGNFGVHAQLLEKVTAYLQAVGPEPAVDYHGLLDDAAFWIEGALKCKEWNWSPDQFDAASDCLSSIRSALVATPPAETVVEAMPLKEIRRRVRNIWGAISSNQVIDKDVEGQAKRLLADIDAALAAKDGRS